MTEDTMAYEKFIKTYKKDDVIFEEKSVGNEMYIVSTGRVRLYATSEKGRRRRLAVLKPGEHFGEMALVDSSPRSATAVAAQDNTRLVALDKPKFLYLIRQQPIFAFTIMETMSKRLRDVNNQLAEARAKRR